MVLHFLSPDLCAQLSRELAYVWHTRGMSAAREAFIRTVAYERLGRVQARVLAAALAHNMGRGAYASDLTQSERRGG